MIKLLSKLAAYLRELAYIFSAGRDMQSRAILLWHTARFHATNAFKRPAAGEKPFKVNLAIGTGYNKTLLLRPFTGDLFVLYEVLLDRCYFVPRSLLPPKNVQVIIDCGANVGITALFFASRYPNARIFCVEAHPDNFNILRQNAQSEVRIIPINAAIVGQPTQTVRMTSDAPAWGNKLSSNDSGIEVPAVTISEICAQYGLEHIDLLKIDIEGAEEAVFARAEFLPRVKLGIIELHDPYSKRRFDIDLAKWNFVSIQPQPEAGLKMLTFRRKLDLNRDSFVSKNSVQP
jgi:FkbM family methyltransferase